MPLARVLAAKEAQPNQVIPPFHVDESSSFDQLFYEDRAKKHMQKETEKDSWMHELPLDLSTLPIGGFKIVVTPIKSRQSSAIQMEGDFVGNPTQEHVTIGNKTRRLLIPSPNRKSPDTTILIPIKKKSSFAEGQHKDTSLSSLVKRQNGDGAQEILQKEQAQLSQGKKFGVDVIELISSEEDQFEDTPKDLMENEEDIGPKAYIPKGNMTGLSDGIERLFDSEKKVESSTDKEKL